MNNKKYIKFNLITFLVLFSLSYSTIFIQGVNATPQSLYPKLVYRTAWETLNDKFYFKSKVDLEKWENKFEDKIETLDDAHKYIKKMISELNDPYTKFLNKEEFKEEESIISAKFTGIGVKLDSKKPYILDVLINSPAEKEGLRSNDFILSVDKNSTLGLSSSQVANLLRGESGSKLEIKLKRGNEVLTKILTREELKFSSVTTKLLDNNIALIKIDSFIPENTSELFKNELAKLMSCNGIIIDLRNNAGGLLKNAIAIADMLLDEGKIVSTLDLKTTVNEFANSNKLFNSGIVVLVNENSASASEILTSALKENKRAFVIGKKTYGKGLVQEIVRLPDNSALHVTIAVYHTPDGNDINRKGIIPDLVVENEQEQLKTAETILLSLKEKKNLQLAVLRYNKSYVQPSPKT